MYHVCNLERSMHSLHGLNGQQVFREVVPDI